MKTLVGLESVQDLTLDWLIGIQDINAVSSIPKLCISNCENLEIPSTSKVTVQDLTIIETNYSVMSYRKGDRTMQCRGFGNS